jgi:uncharacterized protein
MDFKKVKKNIIDRMREGLTSDLFYHKLEHSMDVLEVVECIAAAEKVNAHDTILLQTAAILHDSGFLVQYNNNEPSGCDIAKQTLCKYGYTCLDIQTICNLIMATAIPQNPKNKLEEILCDADLDYLGRDDFYAISEDLRKELKEHGKEFSNQGWLKFEINFLEKHKYFTETSRKLRNLQKQIYISALKKSLEVNSKQSPMKSEKNSK